MRALIVGLPWLLCPLAAAQPHNPAQMLLVWTESPQTRITVLWTTPKEGRVHRALVAQLPAVQAAAPTIVLATTVRFSRSRPELWSHCAVLENLTPWTDYQVVVESDGASARPLRFRTAPADDRPLAILQGGDSRSVPESRRLMNQRIAALAAADPTIVALAHGGDYVYNGLVLQEWSEWLTDHQLTITPEGRMLPVIPARGNHEAFGVLFDEVFAAPGGGLGKNYFATELSAQVVLLTLNTETAAGGNQRQFLLDALTRHRAKRWLVAQYHQPIWPAVKVPCRAKPHWLDLFERFDLDLACENDGHVLKRTVPIRADAHEPSGVTYIGEGGLGVGLRTPDATRWYLQPPGVSASVHHVWELRFSAEQLELKAHAIDGSIADRHALSPRARPAVELEPAGR